jgi:recombination protein RecA
MMGRDKKALKAAMAKLDEQYGKGSVMMMGAKPAHNFDVVSTGSLRLDEALGVGGLPKGRIVELYGPESSGKTTLALHVVANVQAAGGQAAIVDAEHALDPVYAEAIGCDTKNLIISQPDNGEQALEIVDQLVTSNAVDIVVVDSVAALTPKAEIEGDMGDSHMGLHARLMSQALRKLTGVVKRNNVMVIFINQLRMKIGVVFGNPETTTGGNALKFYSSVRLDIRRQKPLKVGDEIIGNMTKVKVVKNKCAPPFRIAEFELMYGKGISKAGELIDDGVAAGVITRKGSHHSYGEWKLGNGRENVRAFLVDNPDVASEIEGKLRG